jgi:spermidine/putrescine transport system permease protein
MEAASDLGARPAQVFYKVVLPMTIPGIVSAFTMVFMPTMSSYVIADVMSENQLMIIGNLIQLNFDQGLWGIGSAIALIMLIIIGISMFLTRNVDKEENARGGLW